MTLTTTSRMGFGSMQLTGPGHWGAEHHRVDERGRCWFCWTAPRGWRLWPKRTTCTVHSALSFCLRQPERFVLSVIR